MIRSEAIIWDFANHGAQQCAVLYELFLKDDNRCKDSNSVGVPVSRIVRFRESENFDGYAE